MSFLVITIKVGSGETLVVVLHPEMSPEDDYIDLGGGHRSANQFQF